MLPLKLLLSKGASYRKLAANEILFAEGEVCHYYYQLVSGQLRWVNFNGEGNEYLQTIVKEGECIGELPLFDGEPYVSTAIANKPSKVIRLPKEIFHGLLHEQPAIHFQFSKLLTTRLRFKFFLMKELAGNDSEKTIQSLLTFLFKRKEHICQECNLIKLNRRQLSQMTGLRVETVIRVMRNLHEKGVIQIKNRKAYYGTSSTCTLPDCSG